MLLVRLSWKWPFFPSNTSFCGQMTTLCYKRLLYLLSTFFVTLRKWMDKFQHFLPKLKMPTQASSTDKITHFFLHKFLFRKPLRWINTTVRKRKKNKREHFNVNTLICQNATQAIICLSNVLTTWNPGGPAAGRSGLLHCVLQQALARSYFTDTSETSVSWRRRLHGHSEKKVTICHWHTEMSYSFNINSNYESIHRGTRCLHHPPTPYSKQVNKQCQA